jgi:hypothetical protein
MLPTGDYGIADWAQAWFPLGANWTDQCSATQRQMIVNSYDLSDRSDPPQTTQPSTAFQRNDSDHDASETVGLPLHHGGEFRDLVVVGYSCRPVVPEARVDGANDGVPARFG